MSSASSRARYGRCLSSGSFDERSAVTVTRNRVRQSGDTLVTATDVLRLVNPTNP
jgi:hypothetical protein